MNMQSIRLSALTVAVAMSLAGCATTGGLAGPGATARHAMDSCNPAASAVGGALVGFVGAHLAGRGGDATRAAAAGAVVGALACLAINAETRRTLDAQAVETEFRRAQGAQPLPLEPKLLAYDTSIDTARVTPRSPVRVSSTIKVLDGTARRAERIEEHLVLLGPDNTEKRRFPKDVAANESGGFENSFTFQFPEAQQGQYRVRTELWVNGQKMDANEAPIQLVRWSRESGNPYIAVR